MTSTQPEQNPPGSDSLPNISLQDVHDAVGRIEGRCHKTPVMTCATIDKLAEKEVFFKCEVFQKIGAFKFRGACNAVFQLDEEAAKRGVVTHSSGNHAQALALAAATRGIPCWVVMPRTAPAVKRRATEGYGATVVSCEPNQAAREATCAQIQKECGATLIHPFNNPNVIAGQGTIAVEILVQVPNLDAIVVPVGGGGMISGICIAAKGINPNIRIFAAEPKNADDCYRSKQAGELVTNAQPPVSIADGLLTSLGSLTWPIISKHVERVVTVSEDEIRAAMRLVWERMKVVIEPSAAVGAAVVLSEEFRQIKDVKRVAVVLCGGNVDLDAWKW